MAEQLISKQYIWRWILILLVIYAGFCLLLFFGQRGMIYLPSRAATPPAPGFVPWISPEGEHWGYRRDAGSDICLFFFHGNGGNAGGWSHAVTGFPGDIFVLEYPGYGPRPGKPSESTLKAAALEAFETKYSRYEKVVVAGQSLGAAVTEAVFSRHPGEIDRLVLITPFTSLAAMARSQFPWVPTRWLLRDQMHLLSHWEEFHGQSFVVLAGEDRLIPRSQQTEFAALSATNRIIVEFPSSGHNSLHLTPAFWRDVIEGVEPSAF